MIEIIIEMDYVIVAGVKVPRPANVSRSEWQQFWERAIEAEILIDMYGGY